MAGLRLEMSMSVPGLALLLTELHSSCPRSLCERIFIHILLSSNFRNHIITNISSFHLAANQHPPPLLHCEVDCGAISILPLIEMDTEAVLGGIHKLVRFRNRCFPARLCGIYIGTKDTRGTFVHKPGGVATSYLCLLPPYGLSTSMTIS